MIETLSGMARIFYRPAEGIGEAMKKKRWLAPLLSILAAQLLFSYLTSGITRNELVNRLSEEQMAVVDKLKDIMMILPLFFIVIILLIAAFFVYLFYKIAETEGVYIHFLSGVMHASLIDLVAGGFFKTILILIKKDLLVFTNLTLFFPGLSHGSFAYIFLSHFDFFSLWYLFALAMGIAYFANISKKKSLLVIISFLLFKSLLLSPMQYIAMRLFTF